VILELAGPNQSCHRLGMEHARTWRIEFTKGKSLGRAVVVCLDESRRSRPECWDPKNRWPIFNPPEFGNPPEFRSLSVRFWWLESRADAAALHGRDLVPSTEDLGRGS
jgi:hypothetical protein